MLVLSYALEFVSAISELAHDPEKYAAALDRLDHVGAGMELRRWPRASLNAWRREAQPTGRHAREDRQRR